MTRSSLLIGWIFGKQVSLLSLRFPPQRQIRTKEGRNRAGAPRTYDFPHCVAWLIVIIMDSTTRHLSLLQREEEEEDHMHMACGSFPHPTNQPTTTHKSNQPTNPTNNNTALAPNSHSRQTHTYAHTRIRTHTEAKNEKAELVSSSHQEVPNTKGVIST